MRQVLQAEFRAEEIKNERDKLKTPEAKERRERRARDTRH